MRNVLMAVLLVLLITPVIAQSFQPVYTCTNHKNLTISLSINDSGNISTITEDIIECPYGCEPDIGRYGADCINPPQAMPIEFYMLILGLSGALLILGIVFKRWLFSFVSTIMFLFVAFQSMNITIMSQSYYLPSLVTLAWVSSIISLLFTLIGVVEHYRNLIKERKKKNNKPKLTYSKYYNNLNV